MVKRTPFYKQEKQKERNKGDEEAVAMVFYVCCQMKERDANYNNNNRYTIPLLLPRGSSRRASYAIGLRCYGLHSLNADRITFGMRYGKNVNGTKFNPLNCVVCVVFIFEREWTE